MEGITQGMPQAVPALQQTSPYTSSTALPARSTRYPEDVLTISAAAMALSRQKQEGGPTENGNSSESQGVEGKGSVSGSYECQTCQRRKYKDVSDDSTVSFQTPTRLTPGAAESQVRAHEQQHVTHEQARADKQERKVVAQSVAIHYAVCSECGKSYVAGGTTTTTTKADSAKDLDQKGNSSLPTKGRLNVFA